jgi:hypothetical protein
MVGREEKEWAGVAASPLTGTSKQKNARWSQRTLRDPIISPGRQFSIITYRERTLSTGLSAALTGLIQAGYVDEIVSGVVTGTRTL